MTAARNQAVVTLAGERRVTCLRLAQLQELQDATGLELGAIRDGLASGAEEAGFLINVVPTVIRLGLEGGGAGVIEARDILAEAMRDEPLAALHAAALATVIAGLFGAPGAPGKRGAARAAGSSWERLTRGLRRSLAWARRKLTGSPGGSSPA